MKMKKTFTILFLILIPQIVFGVIVDCPYFGGSANLLNYPNKTEGKELKEALNGLIWNVVHFFKECLVKPALVIIIIWGGVYIMISTGDPAKVEMGKRILLAGIIGLIIIFVAEEIANFFGKYLH
jgi:hypothetical protein